MIIQKNMMKTDHLDLKTMIEIENIINIEMKIAGMITEKIIKNMIDIEMMETEKIKKIILISHRIKRNIGQGQDQKNRKKSKLKSQILQQAEF